MVYLQQILLKELIVAWVTWAEQFWGAARFTLWQPLSSRKIPRSILSGWNENHHQLDQQLAK